MTDSRRQWLVQPNVSYFPWLPKSIYSGMRPSMWRALRKVQFWSWKRISCPSPWEVEWTKKIEMERHRPQPQRLNTTEAIRHQCPTIANSIVFRLLCVSKAHMDKNHAHAKSTLTTDPAFAANFNINELEFALKSDNPRTAAGFDGVYPEFIRNCGERTKVWLISFMNDVLSSVRLPNCSNGPRLSLFQNRAKMVQILHTIDLFHC
jgi:hypothetical protein